MAKARKTGVAGKLERMEKLLLKAQKMAVKLAGEYVGKDAQGMGALLQMAQNLGGDAQHVRSLLRDAGIDGEG